MDSYKRPSRGSKIYARKKGKEDDTLASLYRESEFAREESEAQDDFDEDIPTEHLEDDEEDIGSSDIDDFLDDTGEIDEEKIPIKKSIQKEHKKSARKATQKKKAKRTTANILTGTAIAIVAICLGLWFFKPSLIENIVDSPEQAEAVADEIYYSPLTGLESTNQKISTAEATCIMIENSVDARPQSGLNQAGIVYEAVAEAGITRFMAIYKDELPTWVGPIRSARQTFVHLARPYNCGYVHHGGAVNAINTLNTNGYRNLDAGWVEDQYVFRVNSIGAYYRNGPHNVYTDAEHLQEWSTAKGWTQSKFNGFKRIQSDTIIEPAKRNATTVTVVMSGDDSYNVQWKYMAETNSYARYHVYGGAHMQIAKNGKESQITTDVVIAMKTSTISRSTEPKWYDHTTTGSGEAFIFQNGTIQKATWRRANLTDELGFYDDEGNAVELNRGRTWISIYNSTANGHVSWK